MQVAFADTVYWQALPDVRDNLHSAAEALAVKLIFDRVRIVTSEMVLTELLNALGKFAQGQTLGVSLIEGRKPTKMSRSRQRRSVLLTLRLRSTRPVPTSSGV